MTKHYNYAGMNKIEAIDLAASRGDLEYIQYKCENDSMASFIFFNNMIDESSKNGHIEVVEYLVERGAKASRAKKYGTEEVKKWVENWKKKNPGKQQNFDRTFDDFQQMKENPPTWVIQLTKNQLCHFFDDPEIENIKETKDQILYKIAHLRNVGGEKAVERFREKLTAPINTMIFKLDDILGITLGTSTISENSSLNLVDFILLERKTPSFMAVI